jgi:hypothetical protein
MTVQWRQAFLVGVGATAIMDLGAEVIRRTTGVPPLDYGLLGRWIGHMRAGRFAHDAIVSAEPVPNEKPIGLAAHYSIGVALAGLLLVCNPRWAERPTLGPALATGVGSTVAPWLIMQPAFGMGLAASKTPNPTLARLRSLRGHAIYGFGLYVTARALARVRGRDSSA